MTAIDGLAAFLGAYPPAIEKLAMQLVETVVRLRPDFAASVKTGWGSVNFRHQKVGYVCGVFPHADRVSLLFENGALLSDPEGVLEGDTRQVRYMVFRPGDDIAENVIGLYVLEAVALKT